LSVEYIQEFVAIDTWINGQTRIGCENTANLVDIANNCLIRKLEKIGEVDLVECIARIYQERSILFV